LAIKSISEKEKRGLGGGVGPKRKSRRVSPPMVTLEGGGEMDFRGKKME